MVVQSGPRRHAEAPPAIQPAPVNTSQRTPHKKPGPSLRPGLAIRIHDLVQTQSMFPFLTGAAPSIGRSSAREYRLTAGGTGAGSAWADVARDGGRGCAARRGHPRWQKNALRVDVAYWPSGVAVLSWTNRVDAPRQHDGSWRHTTKNMSPRQRPM